MGGHSTNSRMYVLKHYKEGIFYWIQSILTITSNRISKSNSTEMNGSRLPSR